MWLVWAPYLITSVFTFTWVDCLWILPSCQGHGWGTMLLLLALGPLGLALRSLVPGPGRVWFPGARPVLALGLLAWALVLGYVSAGASFAVWRRVLLSAHAACKPSICVLMLSLEPRVCIAYAGFCS